MWPFLLFGALSWMLFRQSVKDKVAIVRQPGFKVLVQPGAIYHVSFEFSGLSPDEVAELPREFEDHENIEMHGVSLRKDSDLTATATVSYRALSPSELTIGSKVQIGPYEGKIISVARQVNQPRL